MTTNLPAWTDLLKKAVTEPGLISEAYSRFHNYSVGNQMLAMWQCAERSIPVGPLGTFNHWKTNGRMVRKGEKAIELCMPITGKTTSRDEETGEDVTHGYTRFTYKKNWFVLSQTEGSDYVAPEILEWSETTALSALGIEKVPFDDMDGNSMGYAIRRQVAISPLNRMPHKTMFHEIAHVLLGHTTEGAMGDAGELTPRDLREVEAESVALLCVASLGLDGEEFSRGYIQHWLTSSTIPERSAQKIFAAAEKILKAGRPKAEEKE